MKPRVIINNESVSFEAALQLMDDDLREELNTSWAGAEDDYQGFTDLYCVAHYELFGEKFLVN